MRSLRGRLSLGVGLVIALVLGVFGVLISNYAERVAHNGVDDRLQRTAVAFRQLAVEAVSKAIPRADRKLNAVLGGSSSSLRITVGKSPIPIAGDRLLTGPSPPNGLRTVRQNGEDIRVLVIPLRGQLGNLARLEVATSLHDLERRQSALDRRLLRLGLLALLVAGLGTFVAAVRVLGPLRRLRQATGEVTGEGDLGVRVSETDGPGEVRELAASFNAMLGRLDASSESRERALAATRRFALDAGHELRTPLTTVQATLSALHRHPDVPPEQRTAMLGDALDEQRRLVTLLDGLQAYARGDASSVAHTHVDLGEVVLAVCSGVDGVQANVPEAPVVVSGWEPGLRLLVSNLVSNAIRHGAGDVQVTLTAERLLTVDDNGAGVPVADRELIFEPFARLENQREGSGLGLALVAQQVREHGAAIRVEDAPGGGARFVVAF
ncbi:MAG: two-component system, OmpR family, sensor histidine kinase PrrB [Solirubrobacteraceae bacterium]|nr:two-component system, OmpR family, sensor histidine kinase PrrB [Solirubrobacteraceae bacterium]